MSRPKGSKNKQRRSAFERYWRLDRGIDHAPSKGDRRVRRHRAREELKAEDTAWAMDARAALSSGGLCSPCTLETKVRLGLVEASVALASGGLCPLCASRIEADLALIYYSEDPLARRLTAFTISRARFEMELPLLPLSARERDELDDEYRQIRREKQLAHVDEVKMELRKRRRAAMKK